MIGGIGFAEIAEDVLARHRAAYPEAAAAEVLPRLWARALPRDGEDHGLVATAGPGHAGPAVKADTPEGV